MNKSLKEFCIALYNLKNGLFWKARNIKFQQLGRNIVYSQVRVQSKGRGNKITVGNDSRLKNVTFNIHGDNNEIIIESGCSLTDTIFTMEENENLIWIKKGSTTTGGVLLSAIEGRKVVLGEDGMLSREVYIASGDGHGVVDSIGRRTNYSEDILIGSHVWIGYRTIINKGVIIPDNCIIAAGSVVSRKINNSVMEGSIIAGNPALVVKQNMNWTRSRKDGEKDDNEIT
ncbi:acyltransferase [Oribacterium sinus]|uniref:acyltransferase n=1 Tax=Oribacterium sinus TaxID=237576 RepID=UPI0028D2152D|nr:DapH/DapD/GlmU-related protein [Oribacterium sinus]